MSVTPSEASARPPRVSVVLPTYNRAATLRRALLSVLGQSERDLELIVVDDGSTDDTAAVLAAIDDPRLQVLTQGNRGPASARNAGIRAARAALIAFQDSDDEWLPTKLAAQLALLEAGPAEVGWIGGAHLSYGAGKVLRETCVSPDTSADAVERQLLAGAPWVTPLWLVRRQLLLDAGLFDESLPCLEDWDLLLKLVQRCRFNGLSDVVLVRFGQADSVFGDFAKRKAGLSTLLRRHRQRWLREPALYARWCASLGRLHALAGERQDSRYWLREALRADASQLRSACLLAATWLPQPLLRRLSWSRFAPAL
jgi:glycosyltransferase involved in cell wall biosynthesis